MASPKPTVAVFKFSSCDGCQLSILNLEDELLELAASIDIAHFLEASRASRPGPYDIALVEGSVTTEHEVERIQEIRRQAGTLIALGTCATAGGIQALRNSADAAGYAAAVYEHPEYLSYLETSKPLADYVKVDLELWGCPVNKLQVVELVAALLAQRRPNLPTHSVCLDCKRRHNSCIIVDSGKLCLGPVTRAGCGAICPSMGRGCYGCFGPSEQSNIENMTSILAGLESYRGEAALLLKGVAGYAPIFAEAVMSLRQRKGSAK
jgi:sulfhydrogenase subunit delta